MRFSLMKCISNFLRHQSMGIMHAKADWSEGLLDNPLTSFGKIYKGLTRQEPSIYEYDNWK